MQRPMGHELSLEFLHVVEAAAIAAARTMGQGKRKYSDKVAVEAMRNELRNTPIRGQVVIGEGERDKAPMLYIGEKVGLGADIEGESLYPDVDIAVDPLEGTNLCATGASNAIAVLAAAEGGGLLKAPDMYMNKLVVGPAAKGHVHIDAPVKDNLKVIARRLNRDINDLVVVVLDRPRHEKLIEDIRTAGARIQLIGDGDLSAGISAAVSGSGIHAVMGIGGAPEGVLTAAAMKCLNGEIQARFVLKDQLAQEDHEKVTDDVETLERMKSMGIKDPKQIYTTNDLAPGRKILFAASGVTNGAILKGVRFFGDGIRTQSLIMTTEKRYVRFIDTMSLNNSPDVVVRFA